MNNPCKAHAIYLLVMQLLDHSLKLVLIHSGYDRQFRETLITKPKEFWLEILDPAVQQNLRDVYEAEFAVAEFLAYLQEALLECGVVKEAFVDVPVPVALVEALCDCLVIMLEPTGTMPHSKNDLDKVMSVAKEPADKRSFVLSELVLSDKKFRFFHLNTLLLALCEHDDKNTAYDYIGRFSAACRNRYCFELAKAMTRGYGYEHFKDDHIKHLIKGYARGQPLAQFIVELFSGGEECARLEEEKFFSELDSRYMTLLIHCFVDGTLANKAHPEKRQLLLDRISELLEEGFLNVDDFFGVPVTMYTTQNIECAKWFDERFGGRHRFRTLWMDSYERNTKKHLLADEGFPPE